MPDRVMLSLPSKHIKVLNALAVDAELSKSGYVRMMIERAAMERTGVSYDALADMLERPNVQMPFRPLLENKPVE